MVALRSLLEDQMRIMRENHELQPMPKVPVILPAQVVQGMWQGYGAMHAAMLTADAQECAARIRGRYAVLATGVLGLRLFAYRLILNDQKKVVQEKKVLLESQKNELDLEKATVYKASQELSQLDANISEREKNRHLLVQDVLKKSAQLNEARIYVSKLCKSDQNCLEEYERSLSSVDESGFAVSFKNAQ